MRRCHDPVSGRRPATAPLDQRARRTRVHRPRGKRHPGRHHPQHGSFQTHRGTGADQSRRSRMDCGDRRRRRPEGSGGRAVQRPPRGRVRGRRRHRARLAEDRPCRHHRQRACAPTSGTRPRTRTSRRPGHRADLGSGERRRDRHSRHRRCGGRRAGRRRPGRAAAFLRRRPAGGRSRTRRITGRRNSRPGSYSRTT